MEEISLAELTKQDNIEKFDYTPNLNGMRFLEFLALFFCMIAALVYPVTYFDPRPWMIAPIVLGGAAIALFSVVQYWRRYAKKSYVAYDDDYLYVVNMGRATRIAWERLNLENSGIAKTKERAGVFTLQIDDKKLILRLFSSFVWLAKFQDVLGTMLTHIQKNENRH
ncbi:MAG: hypothetical protein WC966_11310 [Bradymonadales bacterium]|jgi:hypothetical protein